MIQPLVSIIMPAYNAQRFIEESIRSVLNQSYKNWELLIINDSSTDKTKEILEKIQKSDLRIKIYTQEKNKGVVEARNKGIKESKGRFIAFLDSDDIWEKEKLEVQINYMLKRKYDMTYTSYSHIDENGNFLKEITIPKYLNYKKALKGNQIGCLSVIVDTEKIGKFYMPNLKHEDYATWLNILKMGITAYGVQKNLARYRKVNDSLSSNKLKTVGWTWIIFRKNQKLNYIKSIFYLGCHIKQAIKKHYYE